MTEAVVSILLESLTTIIVDGVVEEVRLLRGVKGELKRLKTNLEAIRALLEDAEEKQITDKAIKLWLDRLKEAALDMEDALDEWRTRVLKQRQRDAAENASFLRRKVHKLLQRLSFDHGIVRQHRIAQNIKELNEKLDEIVKERDKYELTATSQVKKLSRRRESTSLVDESRVVGRDGVAKEIISHLLCKTSNEEESCSPIQTISIVGMGGLGKTTLAQVVYNDPEVADYFPSRIWACVSEVFDEVKVAIAIIAELEGIGKAGTLQLQSVPLDALLKRIRSSIQGKKFLLVLDDVWTEKERDFEELKLTFKCGTPGSRILVTTRNKNVARVMNSQNIIHLGLLSEELCWSILKKKAMEGKDCNDLEEVGKGIAAKCRGLPLVAQTLGGLLQFKTTRREWEQVLNSPLWKLDIVEKDVFIPLLLSYYDLPPPIRRCFTFCAIFAKDSEIFTNHLIAYWMAQSYLGSEDDSSQWELKGEEYCKILISRSFFQDFSNDKEGYPCVKMHDLVHDFALFMCKDEFVTEEIFKGAGKNVKICQPEKTRHLTLVIENGAYFPSSISGVEKLRSISTYHGGGNVLFTSQTLRNLFMQAQRLRLLCLRCLQFQDDSTTLPKEVEKLLHLRYLEVSFCPRLQELPREVCKLLNLQYLDLGWTGIRKLPDEIGNLVNLRVLTTLQSSSLTSYPKSVSKLTCLTQLIGAIVRTDCDHPEEFSLGDLANLEQLMVLGMKLVGKSIDRNEARKVNLRNLEELLVGVDEEFMEEVDSIFESLNVSWVPKRFFVDFNNFSSDYERGFSSYT